MTVEITQYNAICNLGESIDEIYSNALLGISNKFDINTNIIQNKAVRIGQIHTNLPKIKDNDFNLRCNQLLLKCLKHIDINSVIQKYGKDNIAVVVATTNTGVEEFETSNNLKHAQIGNPAKFIHNYLGLGNFYTSVSTACSSGIKAISIAKNLIESEIFQAVIVAGVDSIAKVPIFGFDSLGILSGNSTNPFSKNRCGINIGEGAGIFILEKSFNKGINILGIGENTDTYHSTSPDPMATESIKCIEQALNNANLKPKDIEYINLHGTGTIANDQMEAFAINTVFGSNVLCSSTKPLTGHCLGAAATIEIALCCKLLDSFNGHVLPHVYDGDYDTTIKPLKLATIVDTLSKMENCLSLSFGFGGTNAAIILNKGGKNA